MSLRVGIALASYNPPFEYFKTQLETILSQSHTDWRCIITVDRDDDNVFKHPEIINILEDSRFSVQMNSERLGFVGNFNCAIGLLLEDESIEAITCTDQDDEWFPNKLEEQVNILSGKAAGSMIFSDMKIQKITGTCSKIIADSIWEYENRNISHRDTKSVMMRNLVSGGSMLMDRTLAVKYYPIPDWVKFHDHYYAVNATREGGLIPLPKSLYNYNQHGGNVVGGAGYEGMLAKKGHSASSLSEKYQFLSNWAKDIGIFINPLTCFYRFDLIVSDPALYRSYLGYFLGFLSTFIGRR